jgi:diacylglycerol kinase (ATP)
LNFRRQPTSPQRARIIVNPTSGAKSAQRKWPRIKALLEDMGLSFDSVLTQGPMEAAELAREAADQGYDLVVAVGGDGTVNEVVNGLMGPDGKARADLGVIHTGTANDFARNLDLPRSLLKNCRLLVSPKRTEVDIGMKDRPGSGSSSMWPAQDSMPILWKKPGKQSCLSARKGRTWALS